MKLKVEFDNLTLPQALALEDLFAVWSDLGGMGSSRWTAFFADGDGDFRPQITVDGEKPKRCFDLADADKHWKKLTVHEKYAKPPYSWSDNAYFIDYDEIARRIRQERENEE